MRNLNESSNSTVPAHNETKPTASNGSTTTTAHSDEKKNTPEPEVVHKHGAYAETNSDHKLFFKSITEQNGIEPWWAHVLARILGVLTILSALYWFDSRVRQFEQSMGDLGIFELK